MSSWTKERKFEWLSHIESKIWLSSVVGYKELFINKVFPPLNGPCLITSVQVCMWCLHWPVSVSVSVSVSVVITAPPPGPDSVWLLALACSPRCPRPGPAPAEPGLHTPARTAHAQTLHYWHPALQHSTLTHLWQNRDQGDNSPRPSGILGSPITPTSPTQCANIVYMSPTTEHWEHHVAVPLWWGLVSGSQQWEWSPATTGHHAMELPGPAVAGCRIKLIFSSD